MANTAYIAIEVDDAGAIAAFNGMNAAGAKIPQGLAPTVPALEKIGSSAKQSREAAALLSEEFGIKMPRALRNVIAESSVAGSVLKAAFSGAVVAGIVEVIRSAVDNLTHYSEQLKAIDAISKSIMDSASAANKALLGPQNLKQVNQDLLGAQQRLNELNKQFGLTGDAAFDAWTRGVMKWTGAGQLALEEYDKLTGKVNELTVESAKLTDEQRRREPIEVLKLQNAARLEGLEGIKKINEQERGETAVVRAEVTARITTQRVGQAQITDIHAKGAAERARMERDNAIAGTQAFLDANAAAAHGEEQIRLELNARLHAIEQEELKSGLQMIDQKRAAEISAAAKVKEIRRQAAEDTLKIEEDAAVAILPPWQRSYAQIAKDTQDRLREIQRALEETRISSDEAARQSAAAWQLNFAKTRDQLAGDLESLFNDVTSGNIGKRFLDMFKHMVFQMIATWILGMNSMRNASAGAMGGGSGGILGALFGMGGGSGPGGTPPFLAGLFGGGGGGDSLGGLPAFSGGAEANGSFGLFGLGLSAGQGAGTAGGVLPSGSATGGAVAGMGGMLSKLFPNGLSIGGAKLSGSALAMAGIGLGLDGIMRRAHGGGVLGVLEGAAGGAMTGFAVGGPIGALIGGAIGLIGSIFAGLFGEHKGDKARKQVMEPLTQQIKLVKDSYDVFQTDYNSAVSELEALRTQSLATLKSIGGKQVSGNSSMVGRMIGDAETYLKNTEAERHRRSVIPFGPAQFHTGGVVRGGFPAIAGRPSLHWGGEVNANLLTGEGVLNRGAMSRIGEAGLNRMNAGGSVGERHIHVHVPDPKSFGQWLRGGGLAIIAAEWDRAERHGGV